VKKARAVLMVEMKVSNEEDAKDELCEALNRFREATQPSNEWGLTIWMATRKDLEEMAVNEALLPNPNVLVVRRKS